MIVHPTDADRAARRPGGPAPRGSVTQVRPIIEAVAKESGVPVHRILGPEQNQMIVPVRHLAFWRARTETNCSLMVIGRAFGCHHTTIHHGIKKHEERMRGANGAT